MKAGRLVAGGLALVWGLPFATTGVLAQEAPKQDAGAQARTKDVLLFRTGKLIEGQIIEETATTVRIKVKIGNFPPTETTYDKADILKITHDVADTSEEPAQAAETTKRLDPTKPAVKTDADTKKVYVIDLKGVFGEDISQTPIREAVKDAKKVQPDYIIIRLENDWSQFGGMQELPDDVGAAGELFRADDIAPIFAQEIPREWGDSPAPTLVFWVKQAMGGTSLLPFACPNIYFTSDARMGGIGNLSLMLGGTGDEVVRQKLYSAYMAHVESWAVNGGYDYRLVRAMARIEYVLSYKMEGGRPVYLERTPESPDEYLLTDDGKGSPDTIQQLARGTGNDVLTLNADSAKKLLISKGTADKLEDVLFELGISRNYQVVDGNSKKITDGWSTGLDNAKRQLKKLWQDFNSVTVPAPGGYEERQRARGQQLNKIKDMKSVIKRYGEALTGQWYGQNGIPNEQQLEQIAEQIRLQMLADKK